MATVQQWWQWMGQPMHPTAQQVLMTADGGGSNGSRSRLWKVELQKFSDATGLEVHVCHFPPGPEQMEQDRTSPVLPDHRKLAGPSAREPGGHRQSHYTTTEAGLRVEAALDSTPYETGKKVSDEALAQVNLYPAEFHGNDWNDVIKPRDKNQ